MFTKKLNENGISLIQVLLAMALLGGVALGTMRVIGNINNAQKFVDSKADEVELKSLVNMILSKESFCRVSLAGEGVLGKPDTPVTFKKSSIDGDNPEEGLPVELFYSNQLGDKRVTKKLSGEDPFANKYASIEIDQIYLLMNNGQGEDYVESPEHTDVGQLFVHAKRYISLKQQRDIVLKFDLFVKMKTNGQGYSTLISCSRSEAKSIYSVAKYELGKPIWTASDNRQQNIDCKLGQISSGFCSSTKQADCAQSGSNTGMSMQCRPIGGDYYVDVGTQVPLTGQVGDFIECPPHHAVISLCANGNVSGCSINKSSSFILCSPLIAPRDKKVGQEVHKYIWADTKSESLICGQGYYMTGLCHSGSVRQCAFNKGSLNKAFKGARCSKILN